MGVVGKGAPPRVCPGCPAFLLSSWGPLLQPQESQGWKVWLEISSVVHGQTGGICLVAGPFRMGGVGRGPDRPRRLPEKANIWGQGPSGGPSTPKPHTSLPPVGPPPPCPSGSPLPPASSRPPGPWHRRASPPPNHIWFSLGSPKMPLSEPPPPPIPGVGGGGQED